MQLRRLWFLALAGLSVSPLCHARKPKDCVTAEQAATMLDKDVCVTAHVYDVVELPDGTRFLDVCTPETPDTRCQFFVVSRWIDRQEVGDLLRYRDTNVRIRGIVRPMHGRAGMELSHVRQFYGGPPKFRPNPRLAHGFTGEQQRPAIHDPNLGAHGGHRGFMNSRDLIDRTK